MKKFFIFALVVLALLLLVMQGNTYKMNGIVTGHNKITDSAGQPWEYSTNGFRTGERVKIIFQEYGNPNKRADDIIKGVEKNV